MNASNFEDDFKRRLASTNGRKASDTAPRQISCRINPVRYHQLEVLAEETQMTKTGLAEYFLEQATTMAWKVAGFEELSETDIDAIQAPGKLSESKANEQAIGGSPVKPNEMEFSRINCINAAFQHLGLEVGRAKDSKAVAVSRDGSTRLCCLTSQNYNAGQAPTEGERYWFTIYERHLEDIQSGQHAYIVLGCGSLKQMLLIPAAEFSTWCADLPPYTQGLSGWHIHLRKAEGQWELRREGRNKSPIDVTRFVL